MAAGRTGAILIPGPLAIEVDEVNAPSRIGPSTRHAFQGRAGYVEDRQYRARYLAGIELAHDGLYRVHRADLIAVHTADEGNALARLCPLGDYHRHVPVLPRGHLHALEIEGVLLAGLQVVNVKHADDLLPLDHIAGVNCSSWCAQCRAGRRCCCVLGIRIASSGRDGSRRADRSDGCDDEIAAIEALPLSSSDMAMHLLCCSGQQ